MRHVTYSSPEFKENLIAKALASNAPPIIELARQ
jgi:hypothetical protein